MVWATISWRSFGASWLVRPSDPRDGTRGNNMPPLRGFGCFRAESVPVWPEWRGGMVVIGHWIDVPLLFLRWFATLCHLIAAVLCRHGRLTPFIPWHLG